MTGATLLQAAGNVCVFINAGFSVWLWRQLGSAERRAQWAEDHRFNLQETNNELRLHRDALRSENEFLRAKLTSAGEVA